MEITEDMIDEEELLEAFDGDEEGPTNTVSAPKVEKKSLYPSLENVSSSIGRVELKKGSLYPTLPPEEPRSHPVKPAPARPPRPAADSHEDDQKKSKATQVAEKPKKKQSIVGKIKAKMTKSSSKKEEELRDPYAIPDPKNDEDDHNEEQNLSLEDDELAQCWFEVFEEVGLPRDACEEYALGFSRHGIDDTNAGILTDENLRENGVENEEHRGIILRLISGLLQHQKEQHEAELRAQAEAHPVTWKDVEKASSQLEGEIKKYDAMEEKLAKILAGDTDRQRAFKARLAKEREKRTAAREEARRQHALKKAQRTYDRVKKDMENEQ